MIMATFVFIVIGLVAVGIHFFIQWLEHIKSPAFLCNTLIVMEYFVLVVDVVIYVAFVSSDAVKFFKTLKLEESNQVVHNSKIKTYSRK